MTTRKRLLQLLAVVFAFALVAAACGNDSDSDDGTGDTSADADDGTTSDDSGDTDGDTGGETDGDTDEATTDDGGSGAAGGTVSYGIVEPSWIDSFNVQDSEGFAAARLLYDGLTDYNEDLEAIPAVASDWSTEDNTTWTFNLRDDVTFHNGNPVTAQSFIDAFNRAADPEMLSDVAYYGSALVGIVGWGDVESGDATEVTGVTAIDDHTLQIELEGPYALLPKALAHPLFSPVDLTAVEEAGDAYSDAPVGNGPYMMDGSWEHDVEINVVRYEDYYGEPGLPDAIRFGIYDSQETMYLEAQAGNLDIADVPPESISVAEGDFPGRFLVVPEGSYTYLGLPLETEPFDNLDIRLALSLATDTETIIDTIFQGTRTPATGFAPSLAPGAVGECENLTYDPDRAKELYDAAGGLPGDQVTIYLNSGGGHEEWTEAVANGWLQTLGIEADFVAQEFSPYLDALQAGEVDGPFRLGWLWDFPTAENFLSPLFNSDSTDNFSGYASDEFDAAMAEFRAAETEEDGFPALADAQAIVCADLPVIPMYFGAQSKVYSENLSGVLLSVFGYVALEDIEIS